MDFSERLVAVRDTGKIIRSEGKQIQKVKPKELF